MARRRSSRRIGRTSANSTIPWPRRLRVAVVIKLRMSPSEPTLGATVPSEPCRSPCRLRWVAPYLTLTFVLLIATHQLGWQHHDDLGPVTNRALRGDLPAHRLDQAAGRV